MFWGQFRSADVPPKKKKKHLSADDIQQLHCQRSLSFPCFTGHTFPSCIKRAHRGLQHKVCCCYRHTARCSTEHQKQPLKYSVRVRVATLDATLTTVCLGTAGQISDLECCMPGKSRCDPSQGPHLLPE